MAGKEPKYSKEEFARLGEQIYERDIYPELQPDSKGKIVAIDIMTGAWEIDASEIVACRRLEEHYPDAQVWIVRVGYKYVRKFGAGRIKEDSMITGRVTDYEAIIRISICNSNGQVYERDATIDTGFDGWLSLPAAFIAMLGLTWRRRGLAVLADGSQSIFNMYEAIVIWDEQLLTIPIDEADSEPLVGMSLMEGYELTIQAVNGGIVTLKKLPKQ